MLELFQRSVRVPVYMSGGEQRVLPRRLRGSNDRAARSVSQRQWAVVCLIRPSNREKEDAQFDPRYDVPMKRTIQKTLAPAVCLSLIAFTVACGGRWEPGDYTEPGEANELGVGGSNGNGGGSANSKCRADSDGSRATLPFAIVEIKVGPSGFIEVLNTRGEPLSLSGTYISGSTLQALPESVVGKQRLLFPASDLQSTGELFVRTSGGTLLQYVCWGQQPPSATQVIAGQARMWDSKGGCASAPGAGQSLHLTGAGTKIADWKLGTPTPSSCP